MMVGAERHTSMLKASERETDMGPCKSLYEQLHCSERFQRPVAARGLSTGGNSMRKLLPW